MKPTGCRSALVQVNKGAGLIDVLETPKSAVETGELDVQIMAAEAVMAPFWK